MERCGIVTETEAETENAPGMMQEIFGTAVRRCSQQEVARAWGGRPRSPGAGRRQGGEVEVLQERAADSPGRGDAG